MVDVKLEITPPISLYVLQYHVCDTGGGVVPVVPVVLDTRDPLTYRLNE